ncbi:MAG: hypothetical protein PSW75_01545 [bacterium]|nr:hypothetical protein [bacterium]MDI1337001.1 hypothetical protein [Lacunisphaera sp.]
MFSLCFAPSWRAVRPDLARGLVLVAAFTHATWNFTAKRAGGIVLGVIALALG